MRSDTQLSTLNSQLDAVDATWLARFRRGLRRWYKRHGRDLPWRNAGDPYRVWISEIMLQQTTVVAVVPYFDRFLERFPTIDDLAAAEEQEVLRLWEGLGYYSRARNIHKTARQLVETSGGRFPNDPTELVKLPGIGRYTAGAIASFAFDLPAPIVEANTSRLFCRLLGYGGDPRSAEGQRLLWNFATRVVARKSPGEFNQALMDLGATVCTPNDPNCDQCPVRSCCCAMLEGTQGSIPQKQQRPQITEVTEAVVAIRRNGRYLLQRIPSGQRWAGLWDFIRFPCDVDDDLASKVIDHCGFEVDLDAQLAEFRHSVTRYRIQLRCFVASCRGGEALKNLTIRWVHPRDLTELPLSVTGRRLANLVATEAE